MFKQIHIYFFLSCAFSVYSAHNDKRADWTHFYCQKYKHNVQLLNVHKKELFFTKKDIKPFTQLIMSWNVMRPQQGFFSFYVQVRNAQTKEWGAWHHMTDWGCGIQKTYLSKSNGLSSGVHVRLELDILKEADAFCVKVVPHNGADVGLVHALAAATSHFGLFKPEMYDEELQQLSSIKIEGVPVIAQFCVDHIDKKRICSPTSCAMVAEYITGNSVNMLDFIAAIFDEGLSVYGSWQCNMAHVFDVCKEKIHCFVQRGSSFCDIHQHLVKKMPVIVSVRGELPGALKPFPHGHLMVVVGWDQGAGMVICHDPAAESNDEVLKQYPIEAFLRAWERSHRLMYVVQG